MKDKNMSMDLPGVETGGNEESQGAPIEGAWVARLRESELPAGAALTKAEAESRNALCSWRFEGGCAQAMTEAQARMAVGQKIAGKVGALVRVVV